MNRAELKTILKKNHVPDFKYNLDGAGRDDERLCLIYDNSIWQVYYSERGIKTTDKHLILNQKPVSLFCVSLYHFLSCHPITKND